jgi:hypothetical protein
MMLVCLTMFAVKQTISGIVKGHESSRYTTSAPLFLTMPTRFSPFVYLECLFYLSKNKILTYPFVDDLMIVVSIERGTFA